MTNSWRDAASSKSGPAIHLLRKYKWCSVMPANQKRSSDAAEPRVANCEARIIVLFWSVTHGPWPIHILSLKKVKIPAKSLRCQIQNTGWMKTNKFKMKKQELYRFRKPKTGNWSAKSRGLRSLLPPERLGEVPPGTLRDIASLMLGSLGVCSQNSFISSFIKRMLWCETKLSHHWSLAVLLPAALPTARLPKDSIWSILNKLFLTT